MKRIYLRCLSAVVCPRSSFFAESIEPDHFAATAGIGRWRVRFFGRQCRGLFAGGGLSGRQSRREGLGRFLRALVRRLFRVAVASLGRRVLGGFREGFELKAELHRGIVESDDRIERHPRRSPMPPNDSPI